MPDCHLILAPHVVITTRSIEHSQLGLHPDHALVIPTPLADQLRTLCDGSRKQSEIIHRLSSDFSPYSVRGFIQLLIERGLLITTQHNMLSEFAAIPSLHISIYGAGRLGLAIGLLLNTSANCAVTFFDSSPVTIHDLDVWGASWLDLGQRRDRIAQQIMQRNTRAHHAPALRMAAELAICVPDPIGDYPYFPRKLVPSLMALDTPHIFAQATFDIAHVTDVIIPGWSACVQCDAHIATDRDSDWPTISAQLISRPARDCAPLDLVMRTARQVKRIVTEWMQSASSASQLFELRNDVGQVTVRERVRHPECGCASLPVTSEINREMVRG